jgi:single-stranded-DNA-specific exonuclease
VLRRIFARRAIRSPDELELALKYLRPVGEFESVAAAVDLLIRHLHDRIVVVGDFDADGATSVALMMLCLKDLGFTGVDYFIPDRFELGYGLTPEVVERVRGRKPALIVTVDNGVTSVAGVSAARAAGMDVLITDHHLPGDELPEANAILNPNLPGDGFQGKHLAGVGVAFYLLAALGKTLGNPGAVARYLDLVALGTMADLVQLDHSNRILVSEGLRRINAGLCRPGIRALCEISKLALRGVTSVNLAFQLAPRLNAAGRLDDMAIGVRCLTTESTSEASSLAQELDRLNRERRRIEAEMRAEALELVAAEGPLDIDVLPAVVCLYRQHWHEGVVGLVASRIKDECQRPVLAFAPSNNGVLKGSGRSIAGFHIRDALAEVDALHPGLIQRFGGHAMAAGLSLPAEGLDRFAAAMASLGRRKLGTELLNGGIVTDGPLTQEDLTLDVAERIRDAGPWGQGFPEPSFDGEFELMEQRLVGGAHLKMRVRPAGGDSSIGAIAFHHGESAFAAGEVLHLVYRLSVDDFGPSPSVQLIVEHLQASPPGLGS